MDGWTDRWTNIQINQCRCVSFGWHLWQVPAVWGWSCHSPPSPGRLLSGREGGGQCPGSLLTAPGHLHHTVMLREEALERQPPGIPLGI